LIFLDTNVVWETLRKEPDAAVGRVHGGRLATRNVKDFRTTGLDLVSPWNF
jgi:predicted nucleic acid-binding protein